ALSTNPTIYDSLVKQFWQTATANTIANGTLEFHATIDTTEYTITEASIRDKIHLADASGITMFPNNEIFEGMGQMGYPTDGSFTFWKSFFTPQWRFLVHRLLHCISSKSGEWDQFGSNIATALICLSTGRVYNFLQLVLDVQTENKHPYLAVTLTKKILGNMKRGFRGNQDLSAQGNQTDLWESYPHFGGKSKDFGGCFEIENQNVSLSDSEEEETEAQGRKTHDLDPLVSLVQELVTPSKTVNASGEEQVEDISPTTLEAAAILTKVKKIKSVDKGKRYKRRKSSKEFAGTGLDFEEVKSAFEKVNTGGIKVSSGIEEINTGSLECHILALDPVTKIGIRVLRPFQTKVEEKENRRKKQIKLLERKEKILQEEAGLVEAIRLDALEKALEKEEVAKQVHLDSILAQRMAEEQELTEEQKKGRLKFSLKLNLILKKIGTQLEQSLKQMQN
ncbi:hypothetical protein Tco_1225335, partial [Tanacetum coccineum]